MRDEFRAALCQFPVTGDKQENLARAEEMVARAAEAGAQLVVLPEMFNCPYDTRYFPLFAEQCPEGPTSQALARWARRSGIYLVGGSIPEREGERIYNTSLIYGPDGELLGKHRKVHLFDVDVAGRIRFCESEVISCGFCPTVVGTALATLGVAICYDLRFPELARTMVLRGAEVLVYPAAFSVPTGSAHWHVLLRARAVDNQVFVLAASPARPEGDGYVPYGHSLAVGPWGNVLAEAGVGEELVLAELRREELERVRRELPVLKQRRPGLYRCCP